MNAWKRHNAGVRTKEVMDILNAQESMGVHAMLVDIPTGEWENLLRLES